MSAAAVSAETRIKRCAVCKIDRKGRFILADHEAEKLFGLSEVKLFGQPFIEFLDPSDRDALELMANDRNPYETVHDSARLTILTAQGERIPATVIVTVNFGGGNPANYQIVIVPEERAESNNLPTASEMWQTLVDLLQGEDEIDLSDLLELLRSLSDADGIAVYSIEGSSRDLQARTGQLPVSASSMDTTNLEEIRATFSLSGARMGEICFFAPSESSALEVSSRLANLAHALRPPMDDTLDPTGFGHTSNDILDQAEIAAAVLDADLRLFDRNEVFIRVCESLGVDPESDSLSRLLDGLDSKAAEAVRVHLRAATKASINLEFCTSVDPVDRPRIWIRIKPLRTDSEEPLWLMLLEQNPPAGSHPSDPTLIERGLNQVSEHLAAGLETAASLEDGYPKKGNGETDYAFACLGQHLRKSAAISEELTRVMKACAASESPKTILLSRLFARRTGALQEILSERTITVETIDLPKIKTCGRALEAILGDLLEWWGCHTQADKATLKVSAETDANSAFICMIDQEAGLTKRSLRRLFNLNNSFGLLAGESGRFDGRHLGFTRDRLQKIGGSLNIKPESDGSLIISLTVPTQ